MGRASLNNKTETEGKIRKGYVCKGRKKTINKTSCGRKWPVWSPVFDPQNAPENVYVGPFFVFLPGMRDINFFLGAQIGGFWVGAKKFMLKKSTCFFRPLVWRAGPRKNCDGVGFARVLIVGLQPGVPHLLPRRPLNGPF